MRAHSTAVAVRQDATLITNGRYEMARILYTAEATVTGGRSAGHGRTSDGMLDVQLRSPAEMGGEGGGTNPEQLFAVGWSACFMGAMGLAAKKRRVVLPADVAIDAEVDLGQAGDAYALRARLNVRAPGLDRGLVKALVDEAHQTCPYSKATRGNIDVVIDVA
jgi:lipoyl-dependent peroxiredoxin